MANDIMSAVLAGTKKWARTRKQEERTPASRSYRYARMTHERGVQFKEAAWEIMPEAYAKVSGNGEYPANARQLMYAARPHIQKETGKPLADHYFTQVLLPNYLDEHPDLDWDVVYDSRGHFSEPHGGRVIGLGTIEVRDYLAELHNPRILGADFSQAKVETLGPSGSFGAIAFIEKEGFDSMLDKAKIAERFDVGVMSTKGMSVTAARALADEMCAAHDIPLMILRDFDKSGFSIAGTLERDTRRYEFQNNFTRIHLGLSLADVTAMGLEFEHQHHPKGKKATMIANLRENGATEEEIAFLFADFDRLRSTRRVELNAMTSPQFIAFVERKLREHGVAKIVPDQELLAQAFAGMERGRRLEEEAQEIIDNLDTEDLTAPKDLATPRPQVPEAIPRETLDGCRQRDRRGAGAMSEHRMVSVPQWAGLAGLADDGKSIAAARKLLAKGEGPNVVTDGRHERIRLRDHETWAQSNPWAEYLASLSAAEREKRKTQAIHIVGDAAYTARLYDRYSASHWRFQMTFEQWLKRRQHLKDRHSPKKGGSR